MRRIVVTLTTLLATLLAMATALVALAGPAQAADRDCGDFDHQAQAQKFFIEQGGPRHDPHQLDAEGDGKACESLPCPCSSSTGGGTTGTTGTTGGTRPTRQEARVVAIVDGDTIRVRFAGGTRKDVRMIGIDTPEVYGRAECGGALASRNLKRMLPVGARVTLFADLSQADADRYGRILRYVHYRGRDLNRAQVWTGHSKVYVYADDPFKRTSGYRSAQADAKAANRNLWKRCW